MAAHETENGAEAAIAHAVSIAHRIVHYEIDPADGAHALWRIRSAVVPFEEALRVFVGLASQWDELPEQREQLTKEIVVQADRFMARFGK
jgi:hypothetical protein